MKQNIKIVQKIPNLVYLQYTPGINNQGYTDKTIILKNRLELTVIKLRARRMPLFLMHSLMR
jgi:hypothetical protein